MKPLLTAVYVNVYSMRHCIEVDPCTGGVEER